MVVEKEWIENTLKSKDRSEGLDFLYENLKTTLQVIDALRAEGDEVLAESECEEIAQKLKLMKMGQSEGR